MGSLAVNRQGHVTLVRPYPISVAFPDSATDQTAWKSSGEERAALTEELGIEASLLGVGVDRVDYTKGILERFRGIERFLEVHPEYQGRFSFVQIGAPSRTDILRYRQFLEEYRQKRSGLMRDCKAAGGADPAASEASLAQGDCEVLRAASVCLVTSLHDGMNLWRRSSLRRERTSVAR